MSEEENTDKQHEPSQKKLDDARKKGEIPRSTDLSVAASYGGFLLVYASFGSVTLLYLCTQFASYLEQVILLETIEGAQSHTRRLGNNALWVLGSWVIVPVGLIVLLLLGVRGFTFAPTKLKPKLSRVSLVSNAKNKFGRSGLFEFGKSFFKLVIYALCLGLFLRARLDEIADVMMAAPGDAVRLMFRMGAEFFLVAFLVALAIGAVDYLWQHAEHRRKNRMSDKEMRDEQKEAEGDPHMKGTRRQKAQDMAFNQMAAKVPEADVVVVNPEHFAVALAWSRLPGDAPRCVAKGVDETAQAMKRIAIEAGVPIHRDPPTARALHATVEIDAQISQEHFRAVATAIRFADHIKEKRKHGIW